MSVALEILKITARYNRSIKELVEAVGFEDFVNPDINDRNFKEAKRSAEKEKEAFLLGRDILGSIPEVESEMRGHNLRHGTAKELISFVLDFPRLREQVPIIAYGSTWACHSDGQPRVVYAYSWNGKRRLDLRRPDDYFSSCLILAFR